MSADATAVYNLACEYSGYLAGFISLVVARFVPAGKGNPSILETLFLAAIPAAKKKIDVAHAAVVSDMASAPSVPLPPLAPTPLSQFIPSVEKVSSYVEKVDVLSEKVAVLSLLAVSKYCLLHGDKDSAAKAVLLIANVAGYVAVDPPKPDSSASSA